MSRRDDDRAERLARAKRNTKTAAEIGDTAAWAEARAVEMAIRNECVEKKDTTVHKVVLRGFWK